VYFSLYYWPLAVGTTLINSLHHLAAH